MRKNWQATILTVGVLTSVACPAVTLSPSATSWTKISGVWVQQQEFTLGWTRVALRVNGVALPYTELGSYFLYNTASTSVKTIDKKLTAIKLKQPVCTTRSYALAASDNTGLKSALSPAVDVSTYCP